MSQKIAALGMPLMGTANSTDRNNTGGDDGDKIDKAREEKLEELSLKNWDEGFNIAPAMTSMINR